MVGARCLRLAVGRALARPGLRERARELALWAAEHDGPTRAAELVESFGASRGP
jgi:UDP:flavonoid glycosyltransferase YjiC (YdhE family)